jgi:hypothetical protein
VTTIAELSALPVPALRMLAVEILLADPEALDDDVLETCLYLLREKLRTPQQTKSNEGHLARCRRETLIPPECLRAGLEPRAGRL